MIRKICFAIVFISILGFCVFGQNGIIRAEYLRITPYVSTLEDVTKVKRNFLKDQNRIPIYRKRITVRALTINDQLIKKRRRNSFDAYTHKPLNQPSKINSLKKNLNIDNEIDFLKNVVMDYYIANRLDNQCLCERLLGNIPN